MPRPKKDAALDISRKAVEETIRLLGERDDFDVPLAAVAEAVGCTAPALYGHFRNKDALLRAVHDAGFRKLYEEKLALSKRLRSDPLAYLREGTRAYVQFAFNNPTLYRLMFSPPPGVAADQDPLSSDAGASVLELAVKAIKACQKQGFLPGMDPNRYAFTYWAAVHGAVSLTLQNREMDQSAKWDATREAVDTLMEIIAATRPDRNATS